MAQTPPPDDIAVWPAGLHPTLRFAATELRAYLARMVGDARVVMRDDTDGAPRLPPEGNRGDIMLCLAADLPSGTLRPPEVPDTALDDAYAIDIRAGAGHIAGTNPRSVLLGVYRFLREMGCAWVRPGPTGERVPVRPRRALCARLAEAASYRHRAICIEGAVSYRNVADIIAWAPKVGFNGYFFQFIESHIFFERWYAHANNPLLPAEPFDVPLAGQYVHSLRREVTRRGLMLHAVGHGWTCEPLGIRGLGWTPSDYVLLPEKRALLAEVNGRRDIWRGVPLNTNLCYSNPAVRTMMAEAIADYAAEHPEVDLVHVWLADGSNNQCECEACRGVRPADHYLMILNEADALLTRRGLATRLVFLIYVDLLWPPERERLHNPERFVLMFAPITRSYREPLPVDSGGSEAAPLPPFRLNRLEFPSDPTANVAFLRAWQQVFSGDSFDFDYHLWRAHYEDPGHMAISSVLAEDVRNLAGLGLNGYVSCQVNRAFFPTGIPMQVLGRRLWDREASLEEITAGYLRAAYGGGASLAEEYLSGLSTLYARLGPPRSWADAPAAEALDTLDALDALVARIRPAMTPHLADDDLCVAESWRQLRHHADLQMMLVAALRCRVRGDRAGLSAALARLELALQTLEDALQGVLDVWAYIEVLRRSLAA